MRMGDLTKKRNNATSIIILIPLCVALTLASLLQCVGQIVTECLLLFLIRQWSDGSQPVDNIFGLAEIDFVERVPNLVLHVFHHSPHVDDVG